MRKHISIFRLLGVLAVVILTTAAKRDVASTNGPCEDLPGGGDCIMCVPDNQNCVVIPDPAIVGAGLVREGGRIRAAEAVTIVRA